MIVAFSTSSPYASVAALTWQGEVLWAGRRHAPMQAGGACLELLDEMRSALGWEIDRFEAFGADRGPGSFTGVRVGVVLAKTFAFVHSRPVVGADAFDLIDPFGPVVLPSKRGEYFLRMPGSEPTRTSSLPTFAYRGFGPDVIDPRYPEASGFAPLVQTLEVQDALSFSPHYHMEPSISVPKTPFVRGGHSHG